jgi:hypothetical protein
MKHTTITKTCIALIGFAFMLTSCSTWRYNKQQRVRIETEAIPSDDTHIYPSEMSNPVTTSTEKEIKLIPEKNTTVTYGEQKKIDPIKVNKQKPLVVKSIKDNKTPSTFQLLADHFKRHDKKVCKAQDVEKTAASGWVRIMIIFFVVGFILLLFGIFLSIFIFGPFWWLFYAFGGLLILAGFILLILILLGLI